MRNFLEIHQLTAVLLLLFVISGCDSNSSNDASQGEAGKPYFGILQFDVQHNLANDDCLATNSCTLSVEADSASIGAWLTAMRSNSNMAVLHWDRSIPWLVFAQSPVSEATRIAFYDQQLDDEMLAWINAFKAHFAAMDHRYLAVSLLHGERNRFQPMRVDSDTDVEISEVCPTIYPGMQIQVQYDDGTGIREEVFDPQLAYRNFLLYLNEKLQPEYLALIVEANLFRRFCPGQWPGLVDFYHALYDDIRPQVDSDVRLFATMTYMDLLNYDVDVCYGALNFEMCPASGEPPPYAMPDPAQCYPTDMTAVDDFNQGERLEILALSFYPDALLMAVPGYDDSFLYIYPDTWTGTEACLYRAMTPPYINPLEYLDQLGWNKPIAIAETSARSCRTNVWFEDVAANLILQPPGGNFTQAFWLDLMLTKAKDEKFEFYVQSFLRDYDVVGPWAVRQGLIPYTLYNTFNTWSCSGLYDKDGNAKDGVSNLWRSRTQSQ